MGRSSVALLMFLTAASASAADIGLRVELAPISPPVRIGRPMPTVWNVQQASPQLREGRLRFRVRNEQAELLDLTTDELVVHEAKQRFRFLLPAVQTTPAGELQVDVAWLDRRGEALELGRQLLRLPSVMVEATMLLMAEELDGRARAAEADRRLEALKIENATWPTMERLQQSARTPTKYVWAKPRLQTVVVSSPPQEFATDPLGYAAYDVVLVSQSAFRRLRRDQLQALAGWVSAGGRLAIEPDGLVESQHLEFLNRLCVADARGLIWQADEQGRLQWPVQAEFAPLLVATEYGRVVLQPRDAEMGTASDAIAQQNRVANWLWNLRTPIHPDRDSPTIQVGPPAAKPMGSGPRPLFRPGMANASRPNNLTVNYDAQRLAQLTQHIEQVLTPAGVRLVPFWLVATLLIGLAGAIGPGEWFLLGRWRRRAWTWLTWPATTLAVTAALVGAANSYLRSNDEPRTLNIHDLDADGRIVRTNRFELLYLSHSGEHATSVRRGFLTNQRAAADVRETPTVTMTTTTRFTGGGQPYTVQVPAFQPAETQNAGPAPRVTGRVPGQHTVAQDIAQWSPRLNRVFSIPLEPQPGPMDWNKIDIEGWLTPAARGQAPPAEIVKEIRRQVGSKALVAVHHASGDWAVNDDRQWWSSDEAYRVSRGFRSQPSQTRYTADMTAWAKLLWLLTHRCDALATWTPWGPPLSQPQLADVPILEPAGTYEWAVTVVVRKRNDLTVYRRVFGAKNYVEPRTM